MLTLNENECPALARLLEMQLQRTPDYAASLSRRMTGLSDDQLGTLEAIARRITKLVGDNVEAYCDDYRWICETMMQEELEFRRSGAYRHTNFRDVYDEVYSNTELMRHYMNGLLMTQLWWSNHTGVFDFYEKSYLPRLPEGYRHLEIGPGHGLYMYPPALDPRHGSLTAWDISEESARATRESLRRIGVTEVEVVSQDMFDADPAEVGRFDSITFSEVLEHLERPEEALRKLLALLSDDGRLFLHMPVNSPAPDHIFLLRSPEAVGEFVEEHGFVVDYRHYEPQTGMTMEMAREKRKTISVALIARRKIV